MRALRAAVRPLALPLAWQAWGDASREADRSRLHSRARLLMTLLPEWVDGHLLFASQEALEPGEDVAERTGAALAWMRRIAERELARGRGADAARAFVAMSALVRAVGADPKRARALESGLGVPPEALTHAFLEQAAAADPSPAAEENAMFGEIAVLRALLRQRDRAGARGLLAQILPRLDGVRDRELARRWRASLSRLDRWLDAGRDEDLQALRGDALVQDLLPP